MAQLEKEAKVILTPKGVRWFETGHPWVFASDIAHGDLENSGVASVLDSHGHFLAKALFSKKSKIALRILTYKKEEISKNWWQARIQRAIAYRKNIAVVSNATRLINSEADFLPSLIVDQYNRYLSVQFLSAGLEVFRDTILEILKEELQPLGIVEKNDVSVRELEGLPRVTQVIDGEVPKEIVIQEGELKFVVRLREGQKTGAFLDQRNNRLLAGQFAKGDALDVFSYEGWFACHMARKSKRVLCVEGSQESASRIHENAKLNGVSDRVEMVVANAFDWFSQASKKENFDCINLDPPAFVKNIRTQEAGWRGYKEIHVRSFPMLKKREGILITSSCSHAMKREDFLEMLQEAALDTRSSLQILKQSGGDFDHPTLLTLPESDYLKCFFCRVF